MRCPSPTPLGPNREVALKLFIELEEIISFKALILQMGKLRLRGPKPQLAQEQGLLVARQGSVLAVG